MSGGELFDHICERGSYSERDASTVIRQLCEAVNFMHGHGVAHRDLKVHSFLYDSLNLIFNLPLQATKFIM